VSPWLYAPCQWAAYQLTVGAIWPATQAWPGNAWATQISVSGSRALTGTAVSQPAVTCAARSRYAAARGPPAR